MLNETTRKTYAIGTKVSGTAYNVNGQAIENCTGIIISNYNSIIVKWDNATAVNSTIHNLNVLSIVDTLSEEFTYEQAEKLMDKIYNNYYKFTIERIERIAFHAWKLDLDKAIQVATVGLPVPTIAAEILYKAIQS